MKRFTKPLLLIAAASLLLVGGYQWAVSDGHRDPLPGDVGEPMHISMAAFERVTGTGVLRCGYYDWPPYIVKGEELGRPTGPVVELLDQLGTVLGLKIEFVESSLGRQNDDLNEARIDAHCFDAPQSALHFQRFDLGQVLMAAPLYAYTSEKSTLKSTDDLNNPKVRFAAAEGDVALQVKAVRFGQAQLVMVPTSGLIEDLFFTVATGDADVMLADAPAAAAYNAKYVTKRVRQVSGVPLYLQSRYIITAKGDPALRAMIDDGLHQLMMHNRYLLTWRVIDSTGTKIYVPTAPIVTQSTR